MAKQDNNLVGYGITCPNCNRPSTYWVERSAKNAELKCRECGHRFPLVASEPEQPILTAEEIGQRFCNALGIDPATVREISVNILPGEDLLVDVRVRLVPRGLDGIDWAALAKAARVVVRDDDQ